MEQNHQGKKISRRPASIGKNRSRSGSRSRDLVILGEGPTTPDPVPVLLTLAMIAVKAGNEVQPAGDKEDDQLSDGQGVEKKNPSTAPEMNGLGNDRAPRPDGMDHVRMDQFFQFPQTLLGKDQVRIILIPPPVEPDETAIHERKSIQRGAKSGHLGEIDAGESAIGRNRDKIEGNVAQRDPEVG